MPVDLTQLIARLNAYCRSCLEAAARDCVQQGQREVSLSHLALALLADDKADFQCILRRFEIPPSQWRGELRDRSESGPTGAAGSPVFSQELLDWLDDAWQSVSTGLGQAQIRSGALLLALVRDPARYRLRLYGITRLPYEAIRFEYDALTSLSVESTPAPGAPELPDPAPPPPRAVPEAPSTSARDARIDTLDYAVDPGADPRQQTLFMDVDEHFMFTDTDTDTVTGDGDIPARLGKYEIRVPIASGSMGTVLLGYDAFINREVAIKLAKIRASNAPADAEGYRRMFFNELRTAGMLNHPAILAVHDAGEQDQRYYIVMEYVRSRRTLAYYARAENRLGDEQAIELIARCAMALDYAHNKGVIHRDIKPDNILVTDDFEVKLADFSVAVIQREGETRFPAQGLVGSPMYMAPEQAAQESLGPSSDLYALGLVLFELLTSRRPFDADSLDDLLAQITQQGAPSASEFRSDLAAGLVEVVDRATARRPEDRFPSGRAFAEALQEVRDSLRNPGQDRQRHARYQALKAIDFCAGLAPDQIGELLDLGRWVELAAGQTLIERGTTLDRCILVVDGELSVNADAATPRTLGAGDCVAGAAYLRGVTAVTEVRALAAAQAIAFNAGDLDDASMACQIRVQRALIEAFTRTGRETADRSDQAPTATGIR